MPVLAAVRDRLKKSGAIKGARIGMERTARVIISAFVMLAAFAGLFLIGQAAAAGLDSNLAAGMTLWQGLIVCVIVAAVGILILVTTEGKSMVGWIVLAIPAIVALLIVLVSLNPSAPTNQQQQTTATYDVTNVASSLANYTPASRTVTSVLSVNKTTPSMNATATSVILNFTVLRTDAGSAVDVRAVSFSFAPSSVTSALTGISYSAVRPNSDGRPNCNWTVYASSGASTTSRSLSGTAGMTPYESINIYVSVEINPSAIGVSQTAINDVLNLGTFTIAGQTYAWQGLVAHVWFNGGGA
jgi:hypothetical protein